VESLLNFKNSPQILAQREKTTPVFVPHVGKLLQILSCGVKENAAGERIGIKEGVSSQ